LNPTGDESRQRGRSADATLAAPATSFGGHGRGQNELNKYFKGYILQAQILA